MKRNGQAALEFIMTYGWAILVIMVMIGALAYFGVMNPSKFTGDKCMLSTGFTCKDYRIFQKDGSPYIYVTIENKMGDTITVTSGEASFSVAGQTHTTTCTSTPSTIAPDKSGELVCTLDTYQGWTTGQQMKIEMNFKYTTARGSSYTHTINGELTTTVQDNN